MWRDCLCWRSPHRRFLPKSITGQGKTLSAPESSLFVSPESAPRTICRTRAHRRREGRTSAIIGAAVIVFLGFPGVIECLLGFGCEPVNPDLCIAINPPVDFFITVGRNRRFPDALLDNDKGTDL